MGFRSILCLAVASLLLANFPLHADPLVLRFEIHPQRGKFECKETPTMWKFRDENDFLGLMKKGWVTLKGVRFVPKEKFYNCLQTVEVSFPSTIEFYQFIEQADGGVQYPFMSGADYGLRTAIHEFAVKTGDTKTYRLLLAKDTRSSASEMDAPLYAILRKNPRAFLSAFESLGKKDQKIAVATQYDFNDPVEGQQFSEKTIQTLSPTLVRAARAYNQEMANIGSQPNK